MQYISRTPYGTLGRYPTVNKVFWPFQATHERKNKCHNYTCIEENIEAHLSTLDYFRYGWTNEGEKPDLTGKDGRCKSAHKDRWKSGKGEILDRQMYGFHTNGKDQN